MVLAVVEVAPETIPSASSASTMRVPNTLMSARLSRACCSVSPFFFLASHNSLIYLSSSGDFCSQACKGSHDSLGTDQSQDSRKILLVKHAWVLHLVNATDC